MLERYFIDIKNKTWIEVFNKTLPLYEINTKERICHFLAQIFHETANLTLLKENLFYSKAGLLKVFSKYFNEETATLFEKQPEKIANKVYANRMGNADENSGDGFKYRGRGAIQLTGKNNYKLYGDLIKKDLLRQPDLVCENQEIAILTSCEFWKINKLNIKADKNHLLDITKAINGGVNGLDDRQNKFNKLLYL